MNLITHNPLTAALAKPTRPTGRSTPAWRLTLRNHAANAVTSVRILIAVAVSVASIAALFAQSAARPQPTSVHAAAWLIAACILLDGVDGHLARRLNTTSRFGARLDALADMAGFAIAPLLLLFVALPTALREAPAFVAPVGFAAVLYGAACLLRLVRFQSAISADADPATPPRRPSKLSNPRPPGLRTFRGLPTPAAAAALVALALLLGDDSAAGLSNLESPATAAFVTATTLLTLSALLISGARYVHLADALTRAIGTSRAIGAWRATALALLAAALLFVTLAVGPAPAFAAASLAYLVFGRATAPRSRSSEPPAACTLEAA
ncbi:MAG: CDP-alcohol phosphatidyltransferase family protein [Phycisphaerae bacterium]|nr:CDP-alcohol phosphatidyltransferase family protein [Phycisphaerae bacterium]